jgi:hypothetical protein
VLYVNHAAERVLSGQDGLCTMHGVLVAAEPATSQRLAGTIRMAAGPEHPSGGSLAVPRPWGGGPMPCK